MEILDLTTIYKLAVSIIVIIIIVKVMKSIVEAIVGVIILAFLFTGEIPLSENANSSSSGAEDTVIEAPAAEPTPNERASFSQQNDYPASPEGYYRMSNQLNDVEDIPVGNDTIIIERHYHHYYDKDSNRISSQKQLDVSKKKREEFSTNIPRVTPQAERKYDINCFGKIIKDGRYVLMEGTYSDEKAAQKRVRFWRNNGYPKADFFWAPCYDTTILGKKFAVILTRPIETEKAAISVKRKAVQQYMDMNIDLKNPQIIQIKGGAINNKENNITNIL